MSSTQSSQSAIFKTLLRFIEYPEQNFPNKSTTKMEKNNTFLQVLHECETKHCIQDVKWDPFTSVPDEAIPQTQGWTKFHKGGSTNLRFH